MNRRIDQKARAAEIWQPVNRTARRALARARSEPGEVDGSCLLSRSKGNGWLPMNLLFRGVLAGPAPDWVGSSANGARALSPAQRAGLTIEPFVPRPEGTRFRDGSPPFGIDPFVAGITAAPRVDTRSSLLSATHGIESPTKSLVAALQAAGRRIHSSTQPAGLG